MCLFVITQGLVYMALCFACFSNYSQAMSFAKSSCSSSSLFHSFALPVLKVFLFQKYFLLLNRIFLRPRSSLRDSQQIFSQMQIAMKIIGSAVLPKISAFKCSVDFTAFKFMAPNLRLILRLNTGFLNIRHALICKNSSSDFSLSLSNKSCIRFISVPLQ